MKTEFITQTLARFITQSRFEDIPQEAIRKTKLTILDAIGCALGGYVTDVGQIVVRVTKEMAGKRQSTVLGAGLKTSCTDAAFANAALINILDYDDILLRSTHPAAIVVSPVLAVGELTKASGKDILLATSVAYDVLGRISMAIRGSEEQNQKVWGYGTPFGAAAGASKLLGLSQSKVAHAIGIAGGNAPLPSVKKTVFNPIGGGMVKNNYGTAAETGVRAALLARRGFTGPPDIFEGDTGFWRMYGSDRCDFAKMTERLGEYFMITDNGFKAYPACFGTHTSIACAETITRQHKIDPATIERVVIGTQVRGTKPPHSTVGPRTMFDAQFSIPYVTALTLLGVGPGPDWYSQEHLNDSQVRELAEKIEITCDTECNTLPPDKQMGKMQVVTKKGKYQTKVASPRGSIGNPMTDKELEEKFASLARPVISAANIRKVIRLVNHLEDLQDVRELTALLAK